LVGRSEVLFSATMNKVDIVDIVEAVDIVE
jgi:hypothetical protein